MSKSLKKDSKVFNSHKGEGDKGTNVSGIQNAASSEETRQIEEGMIEDPAEKDPRNSEEDSINSEQDPRQYNLDFSVSASLWTVRALSFLRNRFNIDIRLHGQREEMKRSDIFLFNHFARFETFIPQYMFYQKAGFFCRSVASQQFFKEDNHFSRYLLSIGAVPSDYDGLFPFLAEEILRGQKVIIFPEGGLVKDKKILDKKGRYSIYSPRDKERRKHHTGAAVLALTLDAFKIGLLELDKKGKTEEVHRWQQKIGISSKEEFLKVLKKPTFICPANITFYPLRIDDNILRRFADRFMDIPKFLSEELRIEGNFLLKESSMDIRLGQDLSMRPYWHWWDQKALALLVQSSKSMDDFFEASRDNLWRNRLRKRLLGERVSKVRNAYMKEMYQNVTVNLSHVLSTLVYYYYDKGQKSVSKEQFQKSIYLSIKKIQREELVYLHESLSNPDIYEKVLCDECTGMKLYFETAQKQGLITKDTQTYHFLPRLGDAFSVGEVRTENPVMLYKNEVEPLDEILEAVKSAVREAPKVSSSEISALRFEDERRSLNFDRERFSKEEYSKINAFETAIEDANPFLLQPSQPRFKKKRVGVLLVHGLLASPAEVRDFGEKLREEGYVVFGPRLKGHGTSPWDLKSRQWEEWLKSVRTGYDILEPLVDKIILVGFSTGAVLSLMLQTQNLPKICGVAGISTPWKFKNKKLIFVPLLVNTNRLSRWVPAFEGVNPFRVNKTEHPNVNYRHVPLRAVYELRLSIQELKKHLPHITGPVLLLQGDEDPVVDPKSGQELFDALKQAQKTLHFVPSERHGILYENKGQTHELVLDFIDRVAQQAFLKDLDVGQEEVLEEPQESKEEQKKKEVLQ